MARRISTLRVKDDHGTVAIFSQSIGCWVDSTGAKVSREAALRLDAFAMGASETLAEPWSPRLCINPRLVTLFVEADS